MRLIFEKSLNAMLESYQKEEEGARRAAAEQGGHNLNDIQDVRTENGSNQGQNLALTGFFVPS